MAADIESSLVESTDILDSIDILLNKFTMFVHGEIQDSGLKSIKG